jgi:hypothetical protein
MNFNRNPTLFPMNLKERNTGGTENSENSEGSENSAAV